MDSAKNDSNIYSAAARCPLKRASRACKRCNERKVRCDGTVTGFPCTNCRLDGNSCAVYRSRASRARQALYRAKQIEAISPGAQDPSLATVRPKPPHLSSSPSRGSSRTIAREWLPYAYYPSLCATGLLYIDPAKVRHLEASGCLHVPNRNVVLSIMHYYFLFVHPCLPLIDEGEFWHSLDTLGENGKRIPLLLFQAMLFAASCFIPHDVSRRCGYNSLLAARNDFYRKAKMLYEARVEQDALAISQAAVLLSYFTSDQEIWANSGWLHIAVGHARMLQARQYHYLEVETPARVSTLKRLWWCCLIRDRIVSLGMRRPLQIPVLEPDLQRDSFTAGKLEREIVDSGTYDSETRSILFQVMRSLCRFVVAVTDLVNLVYPAPSKEGGVSESREPTLCRLEKANSNLLSWEIDWLLRMDGQYMSLHPNISLFSNLVEIYYQSARIALCNKICSVLSKSPSTEAEDLERLDSCQSEIRSATDMTVNNIRQLQIVGLVEKLPISAAAYTLLPQILLSIVNSSAVGPEEEEKQQRDRTLSMLSEVHDLMGSKFCTRRVVTLISQALTLFDRCYASSTRSHSSLFEAGHRVFTLDLNLYVILVRFIDVSMSTKKVCLEEYLVLCSPVAFNLLQPTVASNSASSDDDGECSEYPVWMEAIGDFFFGQGSQLQMPSLSAPSSPKALSGFAISELYTDDHDSRLL